MDMAFSVVVGERRLQVAGDLDMQTAPLLLEALRARLTEYDVIDIGAVTFIDSSGLRALLEVRRERSDIPITNASEAAMRLFELSGTADLLLITESD